MKHILDNLEKTEVETCFSQALDAMAEQSEEKQRHFMAMVSLLAHSYMHQECAAILLFDDDEGLQIAASNAGRRESIDIIANALGFILSYEEDDLVRPPSGLLN